MDLPPALDKRFWEEIHQYNEEKKMPFITTPERFGRLAGLQEGLQEGIEQFLEYKFGAAGLQLMPEIRQITDIEVLRAVFRSIKTAASPEELRRSWAP